MYHRESSNQRFYSLSQQQHHEPFFNYTRPITNTTRPITTTSITTDSSTPDDVTDDVTALQQGQGHVQGETGGEEPATNEKTALTSRDRQETSTLTRHLSDDSAVAGVRSL